MKSTTKRYLSFLMAWLLLMAVVAHLLISSEVDRWKLVVSNYGHDLVSDLRNKLDANEAVLSGFSAFLLAVDRGDIEAVNRYAASVTTAYPHIYMVEVARKVPVSQQADFVKNIRNEWRSDFSIKDFPELANRGAGPHVYLDERWPLMFMYPRLPKAEAVYGLALETVPYLSHTLGLARDSGKPVASPVFDLYEGGQVYILLQEVDRTRTQTDGSALNLFGAKMAALVLIKTDALLWERADSGIGKDIEIDAVMRSATSVKSTLFLKTSSEASSFDRLLPRFKSTELVEARSQPVVVTLKHQLRWHNIMSTGNAAIAFLYLCTLFFIPWLIGKHFRSVEQSERDHELAAYLATHDVVTALPNRYLFADRFDHAFLLWQRTSLPFALLLIDLDHFKEVNDSQGHNTGDEVLKTCADRMKGQLRACDTVARHGGDEFIILLETVKNADDALAIAEKIKAAISTPIETKVGNMTISCSIGITLCPMHGKTIDVLIRSADRAMYHAKAQGRNSAVVYQPEQGISE